MTLPLLTAMKYDEGQRSKGFLACSAVWTAASGGGPTVQSLSMVSSRERRAVLRSHSKQLRTVDFGSGMHSLECPVPATTLMYLKHHR